MLDLPRRHVRILWTVVALTMGVGLTGRGLGPSSVSNAQTFHASHRPHPTRASRSSPAPARGGGSHGDTQQHAVPRIASLEEHYPALQTIHTTWGGTHPPRPQPATGYQSPAILWLREFNGGAYQESIQRLENILWLVDPSRQPGMPS